MAFAIPLRRGNIHMVAAMVGASVPELLAKQDEAERKSKEENDKKWAIDFFGKDEQWYDETLVKVEEIHAALPKELSGRERTIKTYGWIAKTLKDVHLSIPMETDHRYAEAECIELILTDPDLYHKIQRWD